MTMDKGERRTKDPRPRRGKRGALEKKSEGFLSGVFVLSLSAIIVKIIGLVYKIPMLKLLGSEGMGYFNSAYELYALFCVISTAGLPVAMSVLIAGGKAKGGAERVFRVSLRLFLLLGLVGTAILLGFARPFASFLGSTRALSCILAIAPTVFFICITGAYRGYFQGLGRMGPTAVSQILEALGKLVLGLLFAFTALRAGLPTETVAAFAVLGLTLGVALSALYLFCSKRVFPEESLASQGQNRNDKAILRDLLKTAVPVTLSSAVVSLTKVIDMTMILRRLRFTGLGSEEAFAAYGNYTTLALPLFGLAPALITSVAMPLIPALSRAISDGDPRAQTRSVTDAMRLTALIALPVSLGLALFSTPVLELIFHGETEAIVYTSPLLALLGLSVTLSCMITVSNAVLQAYSRAGLPILSMAVGSLLKLGLAYFLIGRPEIGIVGAPISTFFCDLTITGINYYCICREMKEPPRIVDVLLRPFLAALLSVTAVRVVYNVVALRSGAMGSVACIGLAALLYLPLAFLFGAVDREILHRRDDRQ